MYRGLLFSGHSVVTISNTVAVKDLHFLLCRFCKQMQKAKTKYHGAITHVVEPKIRVDHLILFILCRHNQLCVSKTVELYP